LAHISGRIQAVSSDLVALSSFLFPVSSLGNTLVRSVGSVFCEGVFAIRAELALSGGCGGVAVSSPKFTLKAI
jgi:hypothetical protein